jgi:hypothetical protein
MKNSFDEAYARYLSALEKLDQTEEITEKNMLFRQLTRQLSDLEKRLDYDFLRAPAEEAEGLVVWDLAVPYQPTCSTPAKNP